MGKRLIALYKAFRGGEWFGAGAENGGRAVSWSGDLVPGAYYVLADAQGARTCLLAISGQAVHY